MNEPEIKEFMIWAGFYWDEKSKFFRQDLMGWGLGMNFLADMTKNMTVEEGESYIKSQISKLVEKKIEHNKLRMNEIIESLNNDVKEFEAAMNIRKIKIEIMEAQLAQLYKSLEVKNETKNS